MCRWKDKRPYHPCGNSQKGGAGIMCSGQYDGAVKADIILDGGAQISQFGAGGADSAKDFARQTKPVDDFIVPILAYSAHQGSGGSIGVLVGHHAGQAVIQVIRHHQKMLGSGKLFWVLFL